MPSGNVTLLEAAKYGDNQIAKGMIETIIQENSIVAQLPWMPFAGTALQKEVEGTLPSVNFRNVNEGYTPSWGGDHMNFWGVAILGGEVKVDNFLVDVVGSRASIKAKQYTKLAKSNAMRVSYEAINGDGTNKGFVGIKNLIDQGYGQKLLNATGGATISLDKLDEANDLFENQGGADTIWLNRTVRRQITKKARTDVSGVSLIDVGTDHFGRQVVSWNGIPLTIVGNAMNNSGTVGATFPFTEDPGDSVLDTASLYFVKLGEDAVTGLLGKGGSFDVADFGEQEAAPVHMGRLEWYPGVAVFDRYSVVRLYGITAS